MSGNPSDRRLSDLRATTSLSFEDEAERDRIGGDFPDTVGGSDSARRHDEVQQSPKRRSLDSAGRHQRSDDRSRKRGRSSSYQCSSSP